MSTFISRRPLDDQTFRIVNARGDERKRPVAIATAGKLLDFGIPRTGIRKIHSDGFCYRAVYVVCNGPLQLVHPRVYGTSHRLWSRGIVERNRTASTPRAVKTLWQCSRRSELIVAG